MITTLLGGVVRDADMDAIERLLGSVTNAGEMARLRMLFEPQADGLINPFLKDRMRKAVKRKI